MEKLTESEIYIIDSLFERKQIDRQRLIKAISILPEKLIGDVLNSLTEGIVNITSSNIKEPISTYILKDTPNKLLTIKEIKDFYNIGNRDEPVKQPESNASKWLVTSFNAIHIDSELFPSVKWEDKEPIKVTIRLA